MAFEPTTRGEHSIVEAVFGLNTGRPFTPSEFDKLGKSHGLWKELLPRFHRQPGIAFSIGPDGALVQVEQNAVGAALFDRVKPDGSPEWRLRVEGNSIYINCLSYTRWNEIWARVQPLFEQVTSVLAAEDNPATSIVLQYIDQWDWTAGSESYDLSQLLAEGNMVPSGIFSNGPWWHLHQGRFRYDASGLPPSKLLERLHIDGVIDPASNLPSVKIDSYLSYEFPAPAPLGEVLKGNSNATAWFDALHHLDKELLGYAMASPAKTRIGLNG